MIKRNAEIDIIKGLSILTICLGHVEWKFMWFSGFFITAFFFTAGYTYRDKNNIDFFITKLKKIYIPFVIANGIAFPLWIVISKLAGYPACSISFWEYMLNILKFNLQFGLMTLCWFLLPFLMVSVLFWTLKKIKCHDLFIVSFSTMIFVYFCTSGKRWSEIYWNNCAVITNVGIGLFPYVLGYIWSKHEETIDARLAQIGGYIPFFIISSQRCKE